MRLTDVDGLTTADDPSPADGVRQVPASRLKLGERPLQVGALRAAWGVLEDGLVLGSWDLGDGVHSRTPSQRFAS